MAGLACTRLQVCAYWRESWFRSSLSYPNVSFTQRTVLCTDVMLHDDLVACAHKSRTRMSRSHAQPWQRGISHLLGVKTTGSHNVNKRTCPTCNCLGNIIGRVIGMWAVTDVTLALKMCSCCWPTCRCVQAR